MLLSRSVKWPMFRHWRASKLIVSPELRAAGRQWQWDLARWADNEWSCCIAIHWCIDAIADYTVSLQICFNVHLKITKVVWLLNTVRFQVELMIFPFIYICSIYSCIFVITKYLCVVIIVITWFDSGYIFFWQPLEQPLVIMTAGCFAGCQKATSPVSNHVIVIVLAVAMLHFLLHGLIRCISRPKMWILREWKNIRV